MNKIIKSLCLSALAAVFSNLFNSTLFLLFLFYTDSSLFHKFPYSIYSILYFYSVTIIFIINFKIFIFCFYSMYILFLFCFNLTIQLNAKFCIYLYLCKLSYSVSNIFISCSYSIYILYYIS
jgi:hypothetical protein